MNLTYGVIPGSLLWTKFMNKGYPKAMVWTGLLNKLDKATQYKLETMCESSLGSFK